MILSTDEHGHPELDGQNATMFVLGSRPALTLVGDCAVRNFTFQGVYGFRARLRIVWMLLRFVFDRRMDTAADGYVVMLPDLRKKESP